MIQNLCRAGQAYCGTTDATRAERGIHAVKVGETAGQWLCRWAGIIPRLAGCCFWGCEGPLCPSESRCHGGAGSFEPVVQVHLCVLAETGTEPALPAKPGQLAGPGVRDHEPVAADDVPVDRPRVLQQERALPPGHAAAYALDPDEARRPVSVRGLQELDGAVASDIA